MKKKITALILCGGKGERLRPLTDSLPKPLVLLGGRPILSYVMNHLKRYGIDDVVIAAGYQKEKIHEFFEENHCGLNVKIMDTGNVDIIERIKSCSSQISDDFIVLYGDTIADVNLEQLQAFHLSHSLKATMTLWPLRTSFGLAELDGEGNVLQFREKPVLDHWINIGYFYYEKEILSWIKDFSTYAAFLEFLANQKELKGFKHHGLHITVNSLRELEDAEKNIHEFEFK